MNGKKTRKKCEIFAMYVKSGFVYLEKCLKCISGDNDQGNDNEMTEPIDIVETRKQLNISLLYESKRFW